MSPLTGSVIFQHAELSDFRLQFELQSPTVAPTVAYSRAYSRLQSRLQWPTVWATVAYSRAYSFLHRRFLKLGVLRWKIWENKRTFCDYFFVLDANVLKMILA